LDVLDVLVHVLVGDKGESAAKTWLEAHFLVEETTEDAAAAAAGTG